jgi:(2R)-sulfolactate sulfo-lyase subunit alpha
MVDFVVHNQKDSTGVVVVEGITAGQQLTGWLMDKDETLTVKVLSDIPIGHKLALTDIVSGSDVIKYGEVIGRAITDIPRGAHLHVHNVKTKRW